MQQVFSDPLIRKEVVYGHNIDATALDAFIAKFETLIKKAKPLLDEDSNLVDKVQKRWYQKQLVGPNNMTYGFITFVVTNKGIIDKRNPKKHKAVLEFSFHLKQVTTQALAKQFTSGHLFFSTRLGEFDKDKVVLNMPHVDADTLTLFRDLIIEATPQFEAFDLTDETLIAQNDFVFSPLASAW